MGKRLSYFAILLISISFILLSSISATGVIQCGVVQKTSPLPQICDPAYNGTIVMGLSGITNAMGQNYTYASSAGSYPYVLCCQNFGLDKSCSADFNPYFSSAPKNEILGLSSGTQAHADLLDTTSNPYSNKVCLGSIECISTLSCNGNYPLNLINATSIYGNSNTHLDATSNSNYNKEVCCKISSLSTGALTCTLTNAKWKPNPIIAHGSAALNLTGVSCDPGTPVKYEIFDSNGNSVKNISGHFPNATWSDITPSGTYTFNATIPTIAGSRIKSDTLKVNPSSTSNCQNPPRCSDYTTQSLCQSDSCGANNTLDGINDTGSVASTACVWSNDQCTLVGYPASQNNNPPLYCDGSACSSFAGCDASYTYCINTTSISRAYCWPGFNCPTGDTPQSATCTRLSAGCSTSACSSGIDFSSQDLVQSNVNDTCDTNSGLSCLFRSNSLGGGGMCNGTATQSSTYCSNGACYKSPVSGSGGCADGYTSCVYNDLVACYPGSSCPAGSTALGESNTVCDSTTSCAASACLSAPAQTKGNCAGDAYCCTQNDPNCQAGGTLGTCYSPTNYDTGHCEFSTTHSGDCSQGGFLDLKVIATWTGDPNRVLPSCVDSTRRVECPAQIPLPFFNAYNLIATVIVIVLIYLAIVLSKKKFRKTSSSSKSRRKTKSRKK